MTLFPRLLSIALLFTATLFMVVQDADARRFGGGRSMGRSSNFSAPARPAQPSQASRSNPQQNRSSGASRWLGPLAGLAAGGLLASLFMGDGFQGIQFMDILIIGGLIFGGFWLFRRIKAGAAGGVRQAQYAGAGAGAGAGAAAGPSAGHSAGFQVPEIGSGLGGGAGAAAAGGLSQQAPKWFDAQSFLNGARHQFTAMQKAWDERDIDTIRETVTAALFTDLMQEMDTMGENHTEVVSLDTELLGFTYEPDQVVVSVRMSGMIIEEIGGQPQPFDEVWHVQRDANKPQANWYVAGIQQTG